MTILTKNRNNTGFLLRCQFRKYIGGFCRPGKFRIIHVFQIRTQEHIANLQSDLFTDGSGYFFIITCEDFGKDPMVFQCLDSIGSRLFWWI